MDFVDIVIFNRVQPFVFFIGRYCSFQSLCVDIIRFYPFFLFRIANHTLYWCEKAKSNQITVDRFI